MRALALILAAVAAPVAAQEQCAARPVVAEKLGDTFGESRVALGLTPSGHIMELWANADTGSWTITETYPNGLMCVRAVGEYFSARAAEPGGDPA